MYKFFVSAHKIIENKAFIEGEDVKHIYKVLRLSCGEKININNCLGKEYIAEIESINKKQVIANIIEEIKINRESEINITLFQGLPKASKMDLIVQKSTELGVKEITPIITKRVVVKNGMKDFKKTERWNRIALEACKQCKRSLVPKVNEPIEFNLFLEEIKNYDLIVVPYENQQGYGIRKMISDVKSEDVKNIAVVIGPEGGFEEEEISNLKEIGAYIVTLGPRILRTETAGFVCSSLIMYELGDLGGVV
ncbi:16S rRNA (uracil(1498)-N(3))-methyltransferase [Haloimpatiens sp. FM7330]|uniref:16S rRNA (uracil(1498)-N(3))-methyltransferase n=1 Tax=Haloimpatiens sp. FM7330 TaxID=3298610 RepID=UPI003643658E